ncbi:hypothetical protein LTR35_012078 [Friedmanniomyces endolithicus]|nr:hypothetical protein LTR35_012078 [Friedmanniomyces endolithicus]KAK0284330.1 hypothetical protein LTS00_011287 [Friedmanniomyces endolithicus]KAK0995952.1 hypothetical protein LTR54_010246 [Friedmanniomyces endolithicus]
MKAVFLVERDSGRQKSRVMYAQESRSGGDDSSGTVGAPVGVNVPRATAHSTVFEKHGLPTPSPSPDGRSYPKPGGGAAVKEYVEVFDYVGGARFRGFVAEREDERSMFVFFDKDVIGKDLKPGLMILLELASSDEFECSQLVICVDRFADEKDVKETTRDLGWVGFELAMLDAWAGHSNVVSDAWFFFGMDV